MWKQVEDPTCCSWQVDKDILTYRESHQYIYMHPALRTFMSILF